MSPQEQEQLYRDILDYCAGPPVARRDQWAGQAGALMTRLYTMLDDDRGDDLMSLLDDLVRADPLERDRLVDALLDVVE